MTRLDKDGGETDDEEEEEEGGGEIVAEKTECPFCDIIENYAPANTKYEDTYVIGLESEASQAGQTLLQEVLFLPKAHRKFLTLKDEHQLFEAIDAFASSNNISAYKLIWSTQQCVSGHSFIRVRFPFIHELQSITR